MADDVLQIFAEGRVDARSLSEFLFKPADFMVQRRLAPPINTLNFYLDKFDAVAADANSAISIANNSIGAANAVIAEANKKILAADGVVADAYAGAEQRFFDTANNNLNSQIDIYLSAQDIGKSVFDTPQAGVDAGIANGSYYSVRSTDSDYFLEEYKNNAGTPQATGKKYPAAKFLLTKGVFTVSELLILGATATAGARFNTHGFYTKGDCLPSVFEVQTVAVGDEFTDIGNGTLIGSDASIKINSTKKLKLMADNSVSLSQLGGIKTAQSVTIKNDVIGSVILKNYKRLIVDGFYTLRGTIWHNENNIISGIGKKFAGLRQGDGVNKYIIQSRLSNIKALVLLSDRLEIYGVTIDGNSTKNNLRDYGGDINQTYWGFGVAVFNVNDFYIHDCHVMDTEAWGISFNLCNIVHGENLTFDQVVEFGKNKDGITGTGRRVTFRNISGYTSDDLCAVGTGEGSLLGNDIGITVTQDVEYFIATNIEGLEKGGKGTHFAVGIYGGDNTMIKSVVIDGVRGKFDEGMLRISNYWYVANNLKIGSIKISNIGRSNVQSARKNHLMMERVDCNNLTIDGFNYYTVGDATDPNGANIVRFANCNINIVSIKKLVVEQVSSTQNIIGVLMITTNVRNLEFDGLTLVTDELITNDKILTSGVFSPAVIASGTLQTLSIRQNDIGKFKTHGYIESLRKLQEKASVNTSIDIINYVENDTSLLTAADGVNITRINLIIKDSVLYLRVGLEITVGSTVADKLVFTLAGAAKLKLQQVTFFTPKSYANGANMLFEVRGYGIYLVSPTLSGITSSGVYRTLINTQIALA